MGQAGRSWEQMGTAHNKRRAMPTPVRVVQHLSLDDVYVAACLASEIGAGLVHLLLQPCAQQCTCISKCRSTKMKAAV